MGELTAPIDQAAAVAAGDRLRDGANAVEVEIPAIHRNGHLVLTSTRWNRAPGSRRRRRDYEPS